MSIFQAIILGLVQGITEMLPISSSGHLVLFPWLFNFSDPGLAFDVALHLGTLVAILLFFYKDWLEIIKDFFKLIKTRKVETFNQKMAGFLIIASIPGALLGYLLESKAETTFRNPILIAINLVFFGILLYIADRNDKGERTIKDLNAKSSFIIGLSQALAIIPGTSRSGITITTGLFSGFKREDAAKFSFLISAPIIAGAGILQLKDMPLSDFNAVFWAGFIASVISSILAIGFLLNYARKHRFTIFVIYRFALAALIIFLTVRGIR